MVSDVSFQHEPRFGRPPGMTGRRSAGGENHARPHRGAARETPHALKHVYTPLEQAEQQVRSELSAALDIQEDNLDDFIAEQTA